MNRTTVGLVAGILILFFLAVTLGPAACQRIRSAGLQHRVDQGQIGASQNSAVDAVQAQGAVNTNTMASEDLGRSNAKEIDDAKGSDQRLDADAHAAGLRAICRRPEYRDRERCRLLLAH